MDEDRNEALRHIRGLIDAHKREIQTHYAELKLSLPWHFKKLTIKEIREAGATVDPMSIILSRTGVERIKAQSEVARKKEKLVEKMREFRDDYKKQILEYYMNMKQRAGSLLKKTIKELEDDDLKQLKII